MSVASISFQQKQAPTNSSAPRTTDSRIQDIFCQLQQIVREKEERLVQAQQVIEGLKNIGGQEEWAYQVEITHLQDQLSKQSNTLEGLKKTEQQTQKQHREQCQKLEGQIEALRLTKNELEDKIKIFTQQLEQTNIELTKTKDSINGKARRLENAYKEKADKEHEVKALQQKLTQVQDQQSKLKNLLQEQSKKNQQLQEQLKQAALVEKQVALPSRRPLELESSLEEQRLQNQTLKKIIEDLRVEKKQTKKIFDQRISSLQKSRKEQEKKLTRLRETNARLYDQKIKDHNKQAQELNDRIGLLETEYQNDQRCLCAAKNRIDELEQQLRLNKRRKSF